MTSVTVANISFPYVFDVTQQVKFLPLEALSLCATLEAAGHQVDFRDYQQSSPEYDDPQDPINSQQFFSGANEIVFIISRFDALPIAALWAEQLKISDPKRKIIMGGYGPQNVAKPIIEELEYIDIVIFDTLELVGLQLVSCSPQEWHQIPGIAFRDGNSIHINPPNTSLKSLDELPLPAYHKTDLNSYSEIMLFSARGCPFRCCFCSRSGKLIQKSIPVVVEEIQTLRQHYNQKRFFFYDQTFTLNKKRVFDLCEHLRTDLLEDIEWSCTGRLNIADLEMMSVMAKSGCQMIYFGVESGSDSVLKRIQKRITSKMIEKVLFEAQQILQVSAFFIWGFPFESLDDFQATMSLIERATTRGVSPIIYTLSILPGTQLYTDFKNQLRFSREVWESNWPTHLSNTHTREQIASFIIGHPNVFPGFYTCDSHIEEKLHIVKELGLETRYPDA
jgi:radical SAM superfamily enzyme YgiQ (UPF0313 family)